ncbi:unnamed protein product [Porites evermanni]|uniref:Heparan-alpha-glucosaminide N-acetyltransferase n=1 Tax=Porites evermanni TaxID=104178 RepID=A0ABN8QVK6_9CNID|nr:unnamed protein product [Porites evermanni]
MALIQMIFLSVSVCLCLFGLVCNETPSYPQKEKFSGKLKMDTALLNITSTLHQPLTVWGIDSNCYKCPLQKLRTSLFDSDFIIIKTHYSFILEIKNQNGSESLCRLEHLFGERGWYEYMVEESASQSSANVTCDLRVLKKPENSYMPLWITFAALFGLAVTWVLLTLITRETKQNKQTKEQSKNKSKEKRKVHIQDNRVITRCRSLCIFQTVQTPLVKRRLKSLDTFRGQNCHNTDDICKLRRRRILLLRARGMERFIGCRCRFPMVYMDHGPFDHFILPFLETSQNKQVEDRLILELCFVHMYTNFISSDGNLKFYRIPGVLQRFGVCYLFVAMMQLLLTPMNNKDTKGRWWHIFRDVYGLWKQWIFALLLLAGYLAVTYAVVVPGCPKGYTGPGGIGEGFPNAFNCSGGMAGYIDRIALGEHLYRFPTIKDLYKTVLPFDPEGILGCLTSIVLVFLGVQAGHILSIHSKHKPRLIRWIIWSILLAAITVGLCGVSINEGIVPINKNLWSVSFILATGATSFFLFAICYILTDGLDWWNGAPFFYTGMNSILVYVGHLILWRHFPFSWEMDEYGGHGEKMAMSMTGTTLWCLIAYYLYRKYIFLKI